MAVIGAGGQGTALTKRLLGIRGVRVAAVVDPDSQRSGRLAASIEGNTGRRPDAVADMRGVFDDPGIEAVVVATPNHWHALAAVWALNAGKHLYLEKPATHNAGERAALLAAAKASGLVVEVGTQRRSHPGLQEAIAALQSGIIGPVNLARCYSWKPRPSIGPAVSGTWPGTLDPELWFGPRRVTGPTRAKFHYDWHWYFDYGNGGLGNNGVHRLDVARWGMALPEAPDRVLAVGGRLGPPDAGQTPNTALTLVAFGDRVVTHDLRGLPTTPDAGMRGDDEVAFVGDGASIVLNGKGGRLVDAAGRIVRDYGQDASKTDPMTRHLRGFVKAVRDGDPGAVAVGLAEGVAAAGMCHAPSDALRSGAGRVDPDVVIGQAQSLGGPAITAAVESFLAHALAKQGSASLLTSGIRRAPGLVDAVDGYEYRDDYRLLAV